MIVTPDYNLSDIWHFNYPLKHLLGESFRQGKFPLWTDLIGNGFPIAAEGQIGAFSPFNWIIFGLFPMPLAFTIALISCFAILAMGSYWFGRLMGLTKLMAVTAAAFSAASGYFIVQITHLNLLQSFSFIPWTFFFVERWLSGGQRRNLWWLAMVSSQMILVGYPQTFINAYFLLLIYTVVRKIKSPIRYVFNLGLGGILAVGLAAVQVLPLVELVYSADTIGSAGRQRFIHPLPVGYLLNLLNPYINGNPATGTIAVHGAGYPVYWESLLYLGVIPLGILIIASWLGIKRLAMTSIGDNRYLGIFLVALASLLLAFGKSTPLGLIFKLPPLSFTRIESRFLAFVTWALGMLAALAINWLVRRFKVSKNLLAPVTILLVMLHLVEIGWTFRGYHLYVDDKKWLSTPNAATLLPSGARILSFSQENMWSQISPTYGWQGKQEQALRARETLGPNSNMVFGVRQLGAYAQQYPRRYDYIRHNMYRQDTLGENIRAVFGVTHILDASSGLVQIVPQNRIVPDIRIASRVVPVRDMDEALGRMNQETFSPRADVLWESPQMPVGGEQIVVVNRSFYPGWEAYLGKSQLKIYPVNINQQAVIVPININPAEVVFRYQPMAIRLGSLISLLSLGIWMLLMRRIV